MMHEKSIGVHIVMGIEEGNPFDASANKKTRNEFLKMKNEEKQASEEIT